MDHVSLSEWFNLKLYSQDDSIIEKGLLHKIESLRINKNYKRVIWNSLLLFMEGEQEPTLEQLNILWPYVANSLSCDDKINDLNICQDLVNRKTPQSFKLLFWLLKNDQRRNKMEWLYPKTDPLNPDVFLINQHWLYQLSNMIVDSSILGSSTLPWGVEIMSLVLPGLSMDDHEHWIRSTYQNVLIFHAIQGRNHIVAQLAETLNDKCPVEAPILRRVFKNNSQSELQNKDELILMGNVEILLSLFIEKKQHWISIPTNDVQMFFDVLTQEVNRRSTHPEFDLPMTNILWDRAIKEYGAKDYKEIASRLEECCLCRHYQKHQAETPKISVRKKRL